MTLVLPATRIERSRVSPAIDRLLSGFAHGVAQVGNGAEAVEIPFSMNGQGPAVLLLHGHPQSRVIWHRVAATLARTHTVVVADLRGYGDASKPEPAPDQPPHAHYGKRATATDQCALMQALGFTSFSLVGHDRGARVAHRLALDWPQHVARLMLLDIAPTLSMLEQTNQALATAYWHWFFLVQPTPLPERLIGLDPQFYLSRLMGNRSAGLAPFVEDAWQEYVRHAGNPATVHAMCEDYRAAATIDCDQDRQDRDAGHQLDVEIRVLWGAQGLIGRLYNPVQEWQQVSRQPERVSGRALACGHYIPEEAPEALLGEMHAWLEGRRPDGDHSESKERQ